MISKQHDYGLFKGGSALAGGLSVPAEWETQSCLWVGWPSHQELWAGELIEAARSEIAQMIEAVRDGQLVRVVAMGSAAARSVKALLGSDNLEIIDSPCGDVWLRDTGPIYLGNGEAHRFKHNGWGGKYLYEHDDTIGDIMAEISGAQLIHHDFIMEGGALEHNGEGVLLTTRQCLLNKNRNNWQQDEAEEKLKDALHLKGILWLNDGLKADHTDGHIDNTARFVSENKIVCQKPYGDDDPNYKLHLENAEKLCGSGFEIVQLPSPGLVLDAEGEVSPASHMNFIITNAAVVVPTYSSRSADEAIEQLKDLFPTRQVVGVEAHALLTGGGSFHCISQQEPAKKIRLI
ncbi:MAG: agmatine deiminase [Micavibrio sp.]|nr:agmatine deiminase [Micavibrio sp.]